MSRFRSLIRNALGREADDPSPIAGDGQQDRDRMSGSSDVALSGMIAPSESPVETDALNWQPIERADEAIEVRPADWKCFHRDSPAAPPPEWHAGGTGIENRSAASDGFGAGAREDGRPSFGERDSFGSGCEPERGNCAEDEGDLILVDFEDEEPPPPSPAIAPETKSAEEVDEVWQPIRWPPGPIKGRRPLVLPSSGSIAPLTDGLAVGFQGAWDARGEMIQCYRATLMGASTAGPSARPLAVQAQWEAERIAAIDLALVNAALENLVHGIELRRQVYIVAPIHWTTLTPPYVEALVACLRYFSEGARSRWLCLEIVGVPPTGNPRQLASLCEVVRGLGRELLIAIGPSGPRVAELAELAPSAIGADHRELGTDVIPVMARKAGISRSYIWGIDTAAALHAALESDYSLIGGDAVGQLGATPDRAEFVQRKTLKGGL